MSQISESMREINKMPDKHCDPYALRRAGLTQREAQELAHKYMRPVPPPPEPKTPKRKRIQP